MLSKNNHNLKIKKASDHQLRFSLRKLGTGIASVAIASLFFIGSSVTIAHADTSDNTAVTTTLTTNATTQQSTATSDATATSESVTTENSAATTDSNTTADQSATDTNSDTDSVKSTATQSNTNSATADTQSTTDESAKTTAASQTTEADQTIINSDQNSTEAPSVDNIQHGVSITANNQTTGYNGSSILNADQSDGTFDVKTTTANNNDGSRKVEEVVMLPTFNSKNSTDANMIKPVVDTDRIGTGIQFTSSTGTLPDDLEVSYATSAGDFYTLDELMANADFSWDQVVEIMYSATLKAGETLTAVLPMKIANFDQMKEQLAAVADGSASKDVLKDSAARNMTFDEYFYYWDAASNFKDDDIHTMNLRLAVPATSTMNAIKNISGTYSAQIKNSDGTYSDAPEAIQNVIPAVSPSDVTVTNFDNGSAEDTLFTDGFFQINALNIFNAIKNLGYTTNVTTDGKDLWLTYDYFSYGTVSGTNGAQLYVEVQPVFSLQDVTLPAGSAWNQTLNLAQDPSVKYTNKTTMAVTDTVKLAYDENGGTGTYQVDTSNLPLDADGNLTTPGIYNVTYSYKINDQYTVTATTQVTVQAVKEITRTIHYVDGDNNNQAVANDVTQTLTFYGTPTDAAGTTFNWEAVNGDTFASVDSPAVANMTADTATVAAQTINAASDNTEVTVAYHHNTTAESLEHTVQRTIHFVDANGNPVANDTVQTVTLTGTKTTDLATGESTTVWNSGQFDSVDAPTVANMTPDTATVAAMAVDENTADSEVTVTYSHNMAEEAVEKTVQRTIHFVDANGNPVANDTVQTVTLTGTKTTDLATGESTTVWNSGQFDSVDAPTIANMTPDTATVAAMTVDENSTDTETTVTYSHNMAEEAVEKTVQRTIHFVDANGNPVANDLVQTVTLTGTKTTDLATGESTTVWNSGQFDSVDAPTIANMTPDTATVAAMTVDENSTDTETTVTYSHNMAEEAVEKTVQRTIHFVDANGNPVANDTVQTVTLTGTKTTDLATGESTTVWNSGQFDSVDAPTIANMTPDTATVAAMTVDENTADSEVTVTYSANPVTPDTPDQPVTPDTPTTPDQPSTPETPTTPDQPSTPVTPAAPSQPTTVQSAAADKTTGQKTLPQTGNQESAGILAILGLGLSSLALSFTGLFKKRHN